ncbi:hypothetical protein ACFL1L_03380, partial [Thermoplasmatota archaeon]
MNKNLFFLVSLIILSSNYNFILSEDINSLTTDAILRDDKIFKSLPDDELDQQHVHGKDVFNIYNGFWAAQSFKPSYNSLTRVKVEVNY